MGLRSGKPTEDAAQWLRFWQYIHHAVAAAHGGAHNIFEKCFWNVNTAVRHAVISRRWRFKTPCTLLLRVRRQYAMHRDRSIVVDPYDVLATSIHPDLGDESTRGRGAFFAF